MRLDCYNNFDIPKGNSNEAKSCRRLLLTEKLSIHVGKTYYNKYLNCDIAISKQSVKHISYIACRSYKSTINALNLKLAVENFKPFYIDKNIKSGWQSKKFYACFKIIGYCIIAGKRRIELVVLDNSKIGEDNDNYLELYNIV